MLLELLPLHTALAGMHAVGMLLRFMAPMALAVVGDLLLQAAPCPRVAFGCTRVIVGILLGRHVAHLRPDGKRSRIGPGERNVGSGRIVAVQYLPGGCPRGEAHR